jgi:hypothetical protein
MQRCIVYELPEVDHNLWPLCTLSLIFHALAHVSVLQIDFLVVNAGCRLHTTQLDWKQTDGTQT